ncbi:MAG: hypothetical protein LBT24_03935, partial [Tannerella sp.]|nr:hypothetical protein [Tannerella sp.]
MRKIQLFLLMFVCIQISILAQKKINLNKENTGFQLKTTTSSTVPQQYLKEAKAGRIFAINPALQHAGSVNVGDMVDLQLFESNSYTAQISKIVTDVNRTLTLILRLNDYPMAFALISTGKAGKSLVNVSIPELKQSFTSRCSIDSDVSYLIEIDSEKQLPLKCENDGLHVPEGIMINAEGDSVNVEKNASQTINLRAGDCTPNGGTGDPAQIDLLIVYTAAAEAWANSHQGGIGNTIANMINLGNLALSNSLTGVTLRLAHSARVDYTEAGGMEVSLNRLKETGDGFIDNVHALRKNHGADLV